MTKGINSSRKRKNKKKTSSLPKHTDDGRHENLHGEFMWDASAPAGAEAAGPGEESSKIFSKALARLSSTPSRVEEVVEEEDSERFEFDYEDEASDTSSSSSVVGEEDLHAEEEDDDDDDDMFQFDTDVLPLPRRKGNEEYTGPLRRSTSKRKHSETIIKESPPPKKPKIAEEEEEELFPYDSERVPPLTEEEISDEDESDAVAPQQPWRRDTYTTMVSSSSLPLLLQGERATNNNNKMKVPIRTAILFHILRQFTPGSYWAVVGSQYIGGWPGSPSAQAMKKAFQDVKALRKKKKKRDTLNAHYASDKHRNILVAPLDPFLTLDPLFSYSDTIENIRANASRIEYVQENVVSSIQETDLVMDMATELSQAMSVDSESFPAPISEEYLLSMIRKAALRDSLEETAHWLVFVNEVLLQYSISAMDTTNFSTLFYVIDIAAMIHGHLAVITMLYQLCLRQRAAAAEEEVMTDNSASAVHRQLYIGKYLENAERLMMRLLFFGRTLDLSGRVLPSTSTGVPKFLTYADTQRVYFNEPSLRCIVHSWTVGSARMNFVWGEIEEAAA